MEQALYRMVGSLGTLVTSYFLVDFEKYSVWGNVFLLAVVGYSTAFLFLDGVRVFTHRTRSFNRTSDAGKSEIAKYLVQQLRSSGSVVIFSKDLTWVKEGGDAEALLLKKSEAKELIIFVEDELPITTKLRLKGADVRAYGGQKKKGFTPKSRFTVLDYRAGRTRVMVGIPSDGKHFIKHYGDDDVEVVDLAKDFISLLECTSRVAK
ncbi:MAG: hypothetical protein HOP24_12235 [Sideroxydans sp.]|nr:hypothetical protein [Sideroxydans sp.]